MLLNFFRPVIFWDGDSGGGGGAGTPPAGAPPAGTPPATPPATDPPGPVPYERFKQVNDTLKTVQTELEQVKAAQRTAADQKLADEKKWQELAEQRQKEIDPLKAENLRLRVAMEKNIPADLIERLQGNTREELIADADKLLQFLKPATGPGVPPASKGTPPAPLDFSNMTPEQIREKAKGKPIGELVK